MTEQQFDQMKRLLESSKGEQNSQALDQQILSEAAENVSSMKTTKSINGWFSASFSYLRLNSLNDYLQSGFVPSAVVSISLTLAVFFGLGQLLSIEITPLKNDQVLTQQQAIVEVDKGHAIKTNKKHDIALVEKPILGEARAKVIAQMELPDIQSLLNEMTFEQTQDRTLAENAINIAMADIRSMLDLGRIDSARERYALLKLDCFKCSLPDSLDALVSRVGS